MSDWKVVEGKPSSKKALYIIILLLACGIGYGVYSFTSGPKLAAPTKSQKTLPASVVGAYTKTVTLKNGEQATIVPVTMSQKHFDDMKVIHRDPSCTAMMTAGKPWPIESIRNNQILYAYSWETFHDLKKAGADKTEPFTLGFLIYDKDGKLMGNGGIQKIKDLPDELFFNTLPHARRKGVAYAVGKHSQAFYDQHFGKRTTGVQVLPGNAASESLVKKLGFKPILDKDGQHKLKYHPRYNRSYALYERGPSA